MYSMEIILRKLIVEVPTLSRLQSEVALLSVKSLRNLLNWQKACETWEKNDLIYKSSYI